MTVTTEQDLVDAIRGASGPLAIRGGGTRGMGVQGDVLSVAGLTGITLYEPGALTIVAQAGTPISQIDDALIAENQRLAFEPMDCRPLLGSEGEPTIGGAVAANVSGPRRIAVGAARDFTLGVRFVDGKGTVIKNGGRVMKNVTGYDLVKLMSGACGTLGVLSEVALKVLPMPETEGTVVLHGLSDRDAVAALARALSSPFEVSGAAHSGAAGDARTMLRVEGFEASVAYRCEQLKDVLRSFGAKTFLETSGSAALWRGIRDVDAFCGSAGDVWRVSCKPSDGPALVAKSGALGRVMDWAGGLIWLRVAEGTDLRTQLAPFAGHATLVRADAATRVSLGTFQPEVSGVGKLSAGLRARFDPRGILNVGLMGSLR